MGTETEVGREEGFLPQQEIWNEELAQRLAEEGGIGQLTEEHWRVLRFLREHFIQYGALPPERSACHFTELDPHCVHRLFHGTREAWRIAGLPDPGEEAKSYMD